MTTVTNADGRLAGIFTDGDLRRTLDQQIDINNTPIASLMSTGTKTANPQMLAAEALRIMEEHEITSLVVLDDSGETRGIIHLMHLLHAGIA